MKRKIRVLLSVLAFSMLLTLAVFAKSNNVKIFVSGKPLLQEAKIKHNRVFVPMRVISEELDFDVKYESVAKKISLKKQDKDIELFTGKNLAYVNGKEVKLDASPFVSNNITFVPIRFITQSLEETVVWDDKNKIVIVGGLDKYRERPFTYTYHNKEANYTLELPESWKERAIIENKNGNLYVHDKKTLNKFKADGVKNSGPVFEIRLSDYPIIATAAAAYEDNILLAYYKNKYIEVIFDNDFQFDKETQESYLKMKNEAVDVVRSFKIVK